MVDAMVDTMAMASRAVDRGITWVVDPTSARRNRVLAVAAVVGLVAGHWRPCRPTSITTATRSCDTLTV